MSIQKITLIIGLVIISISAEAQQVRTVGLLNIDKESSSPGYNLFYPFNQPHVYLLDACGEIVHTWPGAPQTQPGNAARLLENGNLIKGVRRNSSIGDPIWAGGGGETIELRSWENDLLWSFTLNNASFRLHHDFDVLPNGNILMIAWEAKTTEEAVAAGRDPNALVENALWPDMILEVDPKTDSIVWEWHAWDHLIQDFDPAQDNFGVIAVHPELIDLNYVSFGSVRDWMHANSIDYNPHLDVILLSVAKFHEVWIIDHSTSKQEAASHSGGEWGRGGDLLFRWGNPVAYGKGDSTDQKLFYQHDAQWLLDPMLPDFGSIAVFNNRVTTDLSTVNILTPEIDTGAKEFRITNGKYLPVQFDRTVMHPIPEKMYSPAQSGVQILPNQNILILAGNKGYAFELTPDASRVVWEYVNPLLNGNPVPQGAPIQSNLVFRFNRYSPDHPAFAGKDLSPKGYLELNPDTAYCSLITASEDLHRERDGEIVVYPNPIHPHQELHIHSSLPFREELILYDIYGREMEQLSVYPGVNTVSFQVSVVPGIYFLKLSSRAELLRLIVQ